MIGSYHRAIATAAVLALTAVLLIFAGPSARAGSAEGELLVGNGPHGPFLDQLETPLFSGEGPFVPGDETTSTFWVKNAGSQPAHVTVALLDREAANDFEAALSFSMKVGGASGDRNDRSGDDCAPVASARVMPGRAVPPDKTRPVHVTMTVADLEGQDGMGELASADLRVTLTQKTEDVEVCGEQATDPDPDTSADPDTGGTAGGEGTGVVDVAGVECSRDVVVTTVGTPTCVPTVVDAGTTSRIVGGGVAREIGLDGLALGLLGGCLLVLAKRRRRAPAPRHRA